MTPAQSRAQKTYRAKQLSLRTAQAKRIEDLEGVLVYYADTFCEHGKYSEVCGHLTLDGCSGCLARQALEGSAKP